MIYWIHVGFVKFSVLHAKYCSFWAAVSCMSQSVTFSTREWGLHFWGEASYVFISSHRITVYFYWGGGYPATKSLVHISIHRGFLGAYYDNLCSQSLKVDHPHIPMQISPYDSSTLTDLISYCHDFLFVIICRYILK
jgi:hypothetical protein